MGLMFVADWISDTGFARRSLPLWVLLAAAVGLTYWECRERGYRQTVMLWWVSFVAITHVAGYVILRIVVRPPRDD
ncbi:MAG: hypothetical protein F4117_14365 [Acidimicrobiales bacterium]|nr:hypothetical protein [Acidimicrobiales bacterium]MYA25899.1 hypothetical protein [Acidimicrobiales bacterium]MYB83124.1 hypothetical protein [Acidimicrobiales bacterium]MYD82074.1 hypothetical protein [Acidimicrobiales bacterium]MYI13734.1 hypothetical protein [Acidimicrobiales bacterium]